MESGLVHPAAAPSSHKRRSVSSTRRRYSVATEGDAQAVACPPELLPVLHSLDNAMGAAEAQPAAAPVPRRVRRGTGGTLHVRRSAWSARGADEGEVEKARRARRIREARARRGLPEEEGEGEDDEEGDEGEGEDGDEDGDEGGEDDEIDIGDDEALGSLVGLTTLCLRRCYASIGICDTLAALTALPTPSAMSYHCPNSRVW